MGATFGTRLMIWWKGELAGEDQFGNKYYREKNGPRRWVVYDGFAEASKVPAEWHAWLHHTNDDMPAGGSTQSYEWEKQHIPNLTGTARAYHPPGSLLDQGERAKATGDYEPWRPE